MTDAANLADEGWTPPTRAEWADLRGRLAVTERRLAAAERVCVMYGWTAARHVSDRDKAAHELWLQWLDISGVSMDADAHPDLSDEYISELARTRDATRAAALARIGLTET